MATSMSARGVRRKSAENGFSLLEVVISMVVLTVGMVSLLGVFGLAMASTQTSQQNLIAKQLADEAIESIITARNTTQISWNQIQNASSCSGSADSTSGGIFLPTTSSRARPFIPSITRVRTESTGRAMTRVRRRSCKVWRTRDRMESITRRTIQPSL